MKLTKEELRTLRILRQKSGHDTYESPIPQLDRMIELGFAEVEITYSKSWGGRRYTIRRVSINNAGRAVLREEERK